MRCCTALTVHSVLVSIFTSETGREGRECTRSHAFCDGFVIGFHGCGGENADEQLWRVSFLVGWRE